MKLILFVVPLAFDTFAVATALGLQGLPKRERLRVSLLMSGFELGMPLVGLLLGRGLGSALGHAASYVAIAILAGLGVYMLVHDETDEGQQVAGLASGSLLVLLGLGISISLDELAMGFTIGLLHLSIVFAVILIGAQAFVAAQLGLRVGATLGEHAREWAERLAAIALLGLAAFLFAEELLR